MTILVTGGAGYIGSHMVLELVDVVDEVVAAGEGELRLEQRRIWEEDGPPNDAFAVLVKAE